jgi:hypothetical protein
MGQSWTTITDAMLLENTDPVLNANFETLRSSFSGAAFPSSPVAGQVFFNSTTMVTYQYNGTGWVRVCDLNQTYGDLVSRSNSAAAPMLAYLHMGSQQIRNMANPSADTHAVTLGYARDSLIATHDHSGGVQGPTIDWDELGGASATAHTILAIASGGSTLINKDWDVGWVDGITATTGTPADQVSVSVDTYANEKKLLLAGCNYKVDVGCTLHVRLVYDQGGGDVQIVQSSPPRSTYDDWHAAFIVGTVTPTVQTTVQYTLQAYDSGSGNADLRCKWILVL